jgi:16S rRNA (uracil1498-N3)-methyltransferase
MARFYCPVALKTGEVLDLPTAAARHVQVLRMQPGHTLTLFNGEGGEFEAVVARMGRSDVQVRVGAFSSQECEAEQEVVLAVGMPANERMDWLIEKATELGVARIVPLMTERTVLRLNGDRAEKKQAHWQSIAVSACEQCGRNRVPVVEAPSKFDQWLEQMSNVARKGILSLQPQSRTVAGWKAQAGAQQGPWWVLSGPEGGLSAQEDALAREKGFVPLSLGARVLRAETAALAVLVMLVSE